MTVLHNFAFYSLQRTLVAVALNRSCAGSHANIFAPNTLMPLKQISILSTRKGFLNRNHQRVQSEPHPKKMLEEEHTDDKHVNLANRSSRKPLSQNGGEGQRDGGECGRGCREGCHSCGANIWEGVRQAKLPDDGTLKDTAQLVKYVSKEAIKDAQLTKEVIHKVDHLKQEVVETVINPINDPKKLLDKKDHGQ